MTGRPSMMRNLCFLPAYQASLFVTSFLLITPLASKGDLAHSDALYSVLRLVPIPLVIYVVLFKLPHASILGRTFPLLMLTLLHPVLVMLGNTALTTVGDLLPISIICVVVIWVAYSGCNEAQIQSYLRALIYIVLGDGLIGVYFLLNPDIVPAFAESIHEGELFELGGVRITGLHTGGSFLHLELAFAMVAVTLLRRSREKALLLLIGLPLLVMTQGKSSLVAVLFFLLGKWIYERFGWRVTCTYICIGMTGIMYVAYFVIPPQLLGGRDVWFGEAVSLLKESPLFGKYGQDLLVEQILPGGAEGEATSVHNVFLYWLTRFGFIYFSLMVLQFLLLARLSPMMLLYSGFLTITGMFQLSILRGFTIYDILYVLTAVLISRRFGGLDMGRAVDMGDRQSVARWGRMGAVAG